MNSTVTVVGGGPAGVMLACELALAGVPVVVLERKAEPNEFSAGTTLHARSVELLEQRGLMDRFREDGVLVWPALHFASLWLDLTELIDDEYSLVAYQTRTEHLLASRAVELGVEIRRGHEVVSLDQDASGVRLGVRSSASDYQLECAYVAGCDGSRSTIRKLSGVTAPATGIPWYGVLGDLPVYDGHFEVETYPNGIFASVTDGSGGYRLSTIEFDVQPPDDGTPVTLDELGASIERVTGKRRDLAEARYLARYADVTRHAETYRRGRVFLVGDAAHVYFFPAGHGLNSALQDAVNLGWKLAAEINGWAPTGLLDTYHDERHPAGRRACQIGMAQLALLYPLERMTPLREVLSELLEFDDVNRHLIRAITDVRYPVKKARGRRGGTTHALTGRRVPNAQLKTATGEISVASTLHTGHGVLLDLSGGTADLSTARGWQHRVDTVTAQPSAEIEAAAALVRPDGHLAWAGDPGADNGMLAALAEWFGEPDGASGQHQTGSTVR